MTTAFDRPEASSAAPPRSSIGSVRTRDVMSAPVVSVQGDGFLFAAWSLLRSYGVQHLVVMDGARVAGIVDESDIVLAWSAEPFVRSAKRVRGLLRARTPCVLADDTLHRAARTLLREDLRALPVVSEHGELIGILTATDILRAVAECATPDEA